MIKMKFWTGIIARLDDIATEKLRALQTILNNSVEIGGHFDTLIPPHMTLFEYPELRKESYIDALNSAIQSFDSFIIEFSGLTTFPATHVFYLNPKYSLQLDQLRRTCLDILQQKGIDLKHDPDSMWNPHLTLSLDLPTKDISKAVEITQNYLNLQIEKPFKAKIVAIDMFSYPPYKCEEKFFLNTASKC